MFNKILIANRGEIACRIAATCKRLGVRSVAVYSAADAQARHVAVCDEAVQIGGAAAADSYLRGARIIEAARVMGAQAVHPGYGFLSENEDFARACAAAGLVFIGPPIAAIAAMGSKAAAKTLMGEAAVPLVPGYHGIDQDAQRLQREADAIGYPVLLKASAGGGGKGMRVVEHSHAFAAALASCQREAASSFGDDRVLLEKYLTRPRHVEVQIFADQQGGVVYLFDRDCSVQRRHQKVLEEAPAPGLSAELRRTMGEAAVNAAQAVKYVGAGTVEFIMTASGEFYFMEMNTRLQVEHPVTEMVTGLDLVEWQLRIAAGEPLPLTQAQLVCEGHAIEARLYAEHPARGFLPSTGTLRHLHWPAHVEFALSAADGARAAVRIDSGVRQGDSITPFYDPMIAKLIVHGASRQQALARMAQALGECEVVGLHTNIAFLQRIVSHDAFASGELDTGLIERHQAAFFAAEPVPPPAVLALACAALLARQQEAGEAASPWTALAHWRLNGPCIQTLCWYQRGREAAGDEPGPYAVTFTSDHEAQTLACAPCSEPEPFAWWRGDVPHAFGVMLGERRITGRVVTQDDVFDVFYQGQAYALEWQNLLAHAADEAGDEGRLTAPMPGKVIAVLVSPGEVVAKGAPLLVMEAMKMEHTIGAPTAGTVTEVHYAVGDQVSEGVQLLVLDAG
ncbi:acetyl/propionyl/methylcrotonyl-CoA carboxylase subunit alpha [Paraburkholderia hayleyella]|uniref:acetyl/propionyl/methylcrotonyl-CoA carboxylase subunit alpha n=1 Tax=Paraburkholderia hayleyella TaxID=2152889 RepID=UPI001292710C|nr:acetyl/propionyl/methylcrotonyl-CoA carboxylase subunit alpha [Paraburkholderia hayleyella]